MKRGKGNCQNAPTKIHKDGKNQVSYRHLLTLSDREVKEGNETNHILLRVGQWSGNQTVGGEMTVSPVTIEKRRVHYGVRHGGMTTKKMIGLNLDDMRLIADRWDEVLNLLQDGIPIND